MGMLLLGIGEQQHAGDGTPGDREQPPKHQHGPAGVTALLEERGVAGLNDGIICF